MVSRVMFTGCHVCQGNGFTELYRLLGASSTVFNLKTLGLVL